MPTVKKRKAAGELVGIGVAMFVEKSGLGPTDGVNISVDTSGMVEVVTGGASIGQGFETVMAQVAADALGVDYRSCRVIHGQTDRIAFGIGAHASRATVMTASATHIAALNVRNKALDIAAELLQTTPDALDIVDGEVVRKDAQTPAPRSASARSRKISSPPRRRAATASRDCPPKAGSRPSIRSIPMAATSPWCASTATPAASRSSAIASPTTSAAPSIRRWCTARSSAAMRRVSAARCSRNSLTASTAIRSPSPSPIICCPRMHETPAPEVLLREDYTSPLNPLGIKGAGESGITGVGAAIASAIDDAIGIPGAVRELPVTPQRLKAMLAKCG